MGCVDLRAIGVFGKETAQWSMEISQPGDGGTARPRSEGPPEEPDPRGFHELAFLGQSNASEAEPELEERDVGPEFDSYEDLDGDKLRLLDRWDLRRRHRAPAAVLRAFPGFEAGCLASDALERG